MDNENNIPESAYRRFIKGENPVFGIRLLLGFGTVAIFLLPWLLTRDTGFRPFTGQGEVGDAINGIAGPFIAVAAAVLTYLAFNAQLNANNAQKKQFLDQANDVKIERFENRFFEMIRIHRANVDEQDIQGKITGRKVFTTYYFELRYIYFAMEKSHSDNPPDQPLSVGELTNLAYLIFFFGIGHVTKSVFEQLAPTYADLDFFRSLIDKLEAEQKAYQVSGPNPDLIVESASGRSVFIQVYKPFTGHGTKLGHYYRHLTKSVRYVNGQFDSFLTLRQKGEYIGMLQSQLSNFEQIMLHYNSMSLLGAGWDHYIIRYKLISNAPLAFTDFGLTPQIRYRAEIAADQLFSHWQYMTAKMERRKNETGNASSW